MKLSFFNTGNCIVEASGGLTASTANAFKLGIEGYIRAHASQFANGEPLIIDGCGIHSIDTDGIKALHQLQNKIEELNRDAKVHVIVDSKPVVRRVLELASGKSNIGIHQSLREAHCAICGHTAATA